MLLAVVIAVAGAVIIAMLSSSPTADLKTTVRTQNVKIKKIHDALIVYYNANTALPKPASLKATSGSAYLTQATGNCDATTLAYSGAGGISSSTYGCMIVGTSVMIGAVPTRTLNLPDDYAFDEWGNRFTYAVDTTTGGGIGITLNNLTNGGTVPITDIAGNAGTNNKVSAVIVSHGKDGAGAYTKDGVANAAGAPGTSTCAKASANATLSENENCNGDATFVMDNFGTGTSYYDDFVSYVAIPAGCNGDTRKCYAGAKIYSYLSYNDFRFNKDGTLKILDNLTYSTTPATPWYIAGNGGVPSGISCVFLPSNSGSPALPGKTGCVMFGTNTSNHALLAAWRIDPTTGFESSSVASSTSDTNVISYGGCSLITGTSKAICIGVTAGGNPVTYTIFRVDFGPAMPTITILYDKNMGNIYPFNGNYSNGPGCTYLVNNDEALCYVSTNLDTYSDILLVRVQHAASGNAVGGSAPVIIPSEILRYNYSNPPYPSLTAHLDSWATNTGGTRYQTPPVPTSGTFSLANTYVTAQEMRCYSLDDHALCIVIWAGAIHTGYNAATYHIAVYRWTPDVTDGVNSTNDFLLLDAAYLSAPDAVHVSTLDPLIWPTAVNTNFFQTYEAVGKPQCFRTQGANTFTCTLRFYDDTQFYLFNLQDCNPGQATPVTNTSGPTPTCFGNTNSATAGTTDFLTPYGSPLLSNARSVPLYPSSSESIGTSYQPSYGDDLLCTGASTGTVNHYCIASYVAHAQTSPFHLWRWTEDTGKIWQASIPAPSGTLYCSNCDLSLSSPYYSWKPAYSSYGEIYLEKPWMISIGIDQ